MPRIHFYRLDYIDINNRKARKVKLNEWSNYSNGRQILILLF